MDFCELLFISIRCHYTETVKLSVLVSNNEELPSLFQKFWFTNTNYKTKFTQENNVWSNVQISTQYKNELKRLDSNHFQFTIRYPLHKDSDCNILLVNSFIAGVYSDSNGIVRIAQVQKWKNTWFAHPSIKTRYVFVHTGLILQLSLYSPRSADSISWRINIIVSPKRLQNKVPLISLYRYKKNPFQDVKQTIESLF